MGAAVTYSWPPDYTTELLQRQNRFLKTQKNGALILGAKHYYKDKPAEFIEHWCITYDPRNASQQLPTTMPFLMFPRQREFVEFLEACLYDRENGLVEKSRDMGATWVCCAFSVWVWLFMDGSAVGWGSRKEQLVDKIGDPDSIFEKMRRIIEHLPAFLLPVGFNPKEHSSYMKLINPENGATITGEAGDNIGRGGRKLIYFKDEAQPLYSKLLTPGGWTTMADIKVGDSVVGMNGGATKVTHVNDAGVHPTYRVTFNDGTFVDCSHNHLWTVDCVLGHKRRITCRTHEMVDNLRYESPRGSIMYRYRVPQCAPVEFGSGVALPLDPYVVGLLLGDGSVSGRKISYTTADPELVDRLKDALPAFCVVKASGKYGYNLGDVLGYTKGTASRIRLAIIEAGIFGKRSWEKFVPDIYKFASISDRLAVVQGLMDTDGHAPKQGGTSSFHSSSRQLAEDVRFIAQSLGGTATLNVKPDRRGFRDQYVVHIALPPEMCPFRLTRKVEAWGKRKLTNGKTILSIVYIGEMPVRCITVEAKDGLYLTDHCTVTHNSAHYERPEKIEAALGDNTDVQIDISSVHGTANVFARRREGGQEWEPGQEKPPEGTTRVFIMDWRHHPAKDQAWYDRRRAKAEREGLLHVFAQEVDRDYAAAVEGVVIPALWVKAAVDIHKRFPHLKWSEGLTYSALDVADGGGDLNAQGIRKGVLLTFMDKWSAPSTYQTTTKAILNCKLHQADELHYDCVGVGSGVKGECNRLKTERLLPTRLKVVSWNGGSSVLDPEKHIIPDDPESPKNKDLFDNLKAQAYWSARQRFEKTYMFATQGIEYPVDEMVALDSSLPHHHELVKELSQPTQSPNKAGKIVVDKQPEGTKSPNLADCFVMSYHPWRPTLKQAGMW